MKQIVIYEFNVNEFEIDDIKNLDEASCDKLYKEDQKALNMYISKMVLDGLKNLEYILNYEEIYAQNNWYRIFEK